jgi:hypothetical protein
METLGELVGSVSQFDENLAAEVETHADRRRVEHLGRLLRRAEADGTLQTLFTPGYPPVRIQVAADDDRAVLVVDNADADVAAGATSVCVRTNGRTRELSLPFEPTSVNERTIAGQTVVTLD